MVKRIGNGPVRTALSWLAFAGALFLAATMLGGCVSTEAIKARAELHAAAQADLANAEKESRALVDYAVSDQLQRNLATLEARYRSQMALAPTPESGARITAAYFLGIEKTKASADSEAKRLAAIPIKIGLARQAEDAVNDMADTEIKAGQDAWKQLQASDVIPAIQGLLDQLEAQAQAKKEKVADTPIETTTETTP